jgi:N-methylhydantoinase B/oxoprolinase/acetone carboxylase alpha subunit
MQVCRRDIKDATVLALKELHAGSGKKEAVLDAIQDLRSQVGKALSLENDVHELFRLQGADQVLSELATLIENAPKEVESRRTPRR